MKKIGDTNDLDKLINQFVDSLFNNKPVPQSASRQDLTPLFFKRLADVATRQGVLAEDLLLVLFIESGVKSGAANPHGAYGLNQMLASVLKEVGWSKSPQEYAALPAEEQILWVEKYLTTMKKIVGVKLDTPAKLYQANFLPGTLKRGDDPSIVLAIAGHPYYDNNQILDFDKDGKITVGDLQRFVEKKRQSPAFKSLLNQLMLYSH